MCTGNQRKIYYSFTLSSCLPLRLYFILTIVLLSLGTVRSELQFTATAEAFNLATSIINGCGWKTGKHLLKSASKASMDYPYYGQ